MSIFPASPASNQEASKDGVTYRFSAIRGWEIKSWRYAGYEGQTIVDLIQANATALSDLQSSLTISNVSNGFNFTQAVPSLTWTIPHSLGFVPNVQVRDATGEVVIADVGNPTLNTSVVTFTAATAGSARCS